MEQIPKKRAISADQRVTSGGMLNVFKGGGECKGRG